MRQSQLTSMNYLNNHATKENNKIPTDNSWESSEEMNQVPAMYEQVGMVTGLKARDRGTTV